MSFETYFFVDDITSLFGSKELDKKINDLSKSILNDIHTNKVRKAANKFNKSYNYRFKKQTDKDTNKDFYSINVKVPGLKKENIEIDLETSKYYKNTFRYLTVKSKETNLFNDKIDFRFDFESHDKIDETSIVASIEDGILNIKVPILVENKEKEKFKINIT